ncbi:MAG: flagellar biosynthetic protein FliP, partial [Pseudomonadota bacterium]
MRLSRHIFLSLSISAVCLISPALAQDTSQAVEAFLEGSNSLNQGLVPLFLMVTVLSLAPGIAMMVTCFPFMAIVFSFLRQAIGLQHAPPAMMLTSLALFLTFFVMEPVFKDAWALGIQPYLDGQITEVEGFSAATGPIREFMLTRTSPDTIDRLMDAARVAPPTGETPMSVLIPSFMLSEITRAFQIG